MNVAELERRMTDAGCLVRYSNNWRAVICTHPKKRPNMYDPIFFDDVKEWALEATK